MSNNIPNTFQHPNEFVDKLMHLLTPEENTVLTFAVRQILGWDESRGTLRKKIALSVFTDGYEVQGFRINNGCGLSVNTVRSCLSNLIEFGILEQASNPKKSPKGIEYKLNLESDAINWRTLKKRKEEWSKATANRADRFKRVTTP